MAVALTTGFKLINGLWVIEKDPSDILDYFLDIEDELEVGENITTLDVAVSSDLTKMSQSFTSTRMTVWLTGGVIARRGYSSARFRWTTSHGRQLDQTLYFLIKEH